MEILWRLGQHDGLKGRSELEALNRDRAVEGGRCGSQAERQKKEEDAAKAAAKKAASKAKKKEKKAGKPADAAAPAGGVEASAKGGAEATTATTEGKNDEAVEKVTDGVSQVTIPTS